MTLMLVIYMSATFLFARGATSCNGSHQVVQCSPLGIYDDDTLNASSRPFARVLYASNFGNAAMDWGDRINLAIEAAESSATIILPAGRIELSHPIKGWRLSNTRTHNTSAAGVPLAKIADAWQAIVGGVVSDIRVGIELRGAGGGGPGFHLGRGSTQLFWTGSRDQVVIDLPSPWYSRLSDFSIDGNYVPGLIGIRYRAAWEFGHDGGKRNVFERISMTGVEVGFHIGGPFPPDLVASSFHNIYVENMYAS